MEDDKIDEGHHSLSDNPYRHGSPEGVLWRNWWWAKDSMWNNEDKIRRLTVDLAEAEERKVENQKEIDEYAYAIKMLTGKMPEE